MATIEYDIKYSKNGKTVVTRDVIAVDKGDKIIFKSNYGETGIRYEGRSPFTGSKEPQAGQVFKVGKSAGPFPVDIPSNGKPRKFKCGEIDMSTKTIHTKPVNTKPIEDPTPTPILKLKSWKGGGNDTP
jgi:hypothetical protein